MTEIEWGPEIPVDGKRPEWLRDDDRLQWKLDTTSWSFWEGDDGRQRSVAASILMWSASITHIRLPADHPYYTATEKGFTYWPGGSEAPADWDGGETLARNGKSVAKPSYWRRYSGRWDIIGYRKRVEPSSWPQSVAAELGIDFSKLAATYENGHPYSIGSDQWPGLSKLIEEAGEVIQVAGKLIQRPTGLHWSGDLRQMLTEEIGDLYAALDFFVEKNGLPVDVRRSEKLAKFNAWHSEAQPPVANEWAYGPWVECSKGTPVIPTGAYYEHRKLNDSATTGVTKMEAISSSYDWVEGHVRRAYRIGEWYDHDGSAPPALELGTPFDVERDNGVQVSGIYIVHSALENWRAVTRFRPTAAAPEAAR